MKDWFTPVAPEDSKVGEIGKKNLFVGELEFNFLIFLENYQGLEFYNIRGIDSKNQYGFDRKIIPLIYDNTLVTTDMFWHLISVELKKGLNLYHREIFNAPPRNAQLS